MLKTATQYSTFIHSHQQHIPLNLEKSVEREKGMQEIDVHGEIKNTVVIAMDGEYAGNAGAISCHLIGEERIFDFIRRVKILCRLS